MPMQKRFHHPPIMSKLRLLKPFSTSGKPKPSSHRTEGAAHYSYWESLEKSRKLTWLSSRVQTRLLHSMQILRISLLAAQLPCCSSSPPTAPVAALAALSNHTPHTQHRARRAAGQEVWIPISPRHLTLGAVSIQLKYLGGKHNHCTPQTRQGSPTDNNSCD